MQLSIIKKGNYDSWRIAITGIILLSLTLAVPACFSGEQASPYYGQVKVPRKQELRWSDGGLPQVFDPAFAAVPPDTDAVRALFEGLTDYDPRTLQATPGVAERWESSEDGRVWTFYLRSDARWSSGELVTAGDFVRSWQRILRLGDLAPHTELLSNIVGAKTYFGPAGTVVPAGPVATTGRQNTNDSREASGKVGRRPFGAREINAHVLRVQLQRPNPNFPTLVAHPVFRPVKIREQDQNKKMPAAGLISNGAFHLFRSTSDGVFLQRAENYWDKQGVNLEQVEFVKTSDAETALDEYHAGVIDAVTNAPFEPLALKLLAPYADYRRHTFAALTYYSFNTARMPFNDVRVREALAIAIDRERISEEQTGGATVAASTFLPVMAADVSDQPVVAKSATLNKDQERAKNLLAEAGFPGGRGFPVIHLLVNRNEQQRQVAEAVAANWLAVLNIQTDIEVRNWDEYEADVRAGNYDLVRRGAVMQSADETTSIRILFGFEQRAAAVAAGETAQAMEKDGVGNGQPASRNRAPVIESEADALRQVAAIPIYFASSYALVKPYVKGFASNMLDAPSLKHVSIDTAWQPPKASAQDSP